MGRGAIWGLAALVAVTVGGGAQAAPPADFAARAQEALEAAYPADRPGAAAIVTRGGETIYVGGRGLADVEAGRPITPDTVFRLASITKQFTAAVILQLVQEGRISLDDPVSRFFPDYPQPGAGATVRQLLNHTSGIQSYTGIPGWMTEANTGRAYSTAEMIAVFRDMPSPTPPGQAWAYNNSGYVLLGAIIESVTGMAWHEAVERRLAGPLGLASIGYGGDRETLPAMARGYTAGPDGAVQPARRLHMSVPHGAGALVGTVGDLARWSHALHHGRVVGPELYAAMTTPATLAGGGTAPYGFGLGMSELRGRPTIEHNGGIFGFGTESIYLPGDDLFVAVFVNSEAAASSASMMARRLAALALGDPFRTFTRIEPDLAALAPLFGVYRIEESGVQRRFFTRDGKLFTMREDGGAASEVHAAADGHFFYPASFNWFRIVRAADGTPVMEMHQGGGDTAERAPRTGDVPPEPAAVAVDRAVLQSYVGTYRTAGPQAEIALTAAGVLTIQVQGQPALPLRATGTAEFAVEGVAARIVFHPENGRTDRMVIHQGGRELEARRVEP